MKTSRLAGFFCKSLLGLWLLAAAVTPAYGGCLAGAFDEVFGTLLLQDMSAKLTAQLKAKTERILEARWGSIDPAKRAQSAIVDMEKSLCVAQDEARKLSRSVGEYTAEVQATILTSERVLASSRTSFDEVGKGVAAMAVRGELTDQTIADILQKSSQILELEPFKTANYTSAELLYRIKIIHEAKPNLPVGRLFTKLQNAEETGVIAEAHVAAHLKRTKGLEEMGCDEIAGGPLYGLGVDMRTPALPGQPGELYQVGLSGNAIKEKISDKAAETGQHIRDALAVMPPGTKFKFAQVQDAGWKPTDYQLGQLNEELRRWNVLELTMDDFVEIHLSTDPPLP